MTKVGKLYKDNDWCKHCDMPKIDGYIIFPFLKVKVCLKCLEADIDNWGPIRTAIFDAFIWPLWDGRVTIRK